MQRRNPLHMEDRVLQHVWEIPYPQLYLLHYRLMQTDSRLIPVNPEVILGQNSDVAAWRKL